MRKILLTILVATATYTLFASEHQEEITLEAKNFAVSLRQDPAFEALLSGYITNLYAIRGTSSEIASRLSDYALQDPDRAKWYHDASDKEAKAFLAACELRAQIAHELQKKFSHRK